MNGGKNKFGFGLFNPQSMGTASDKFSVFSNNQSDVLQWVNAICKAVRQSEAKAQIPKVVPLIPLRNLNRSATYFSGIQHRESIIERENILESMAKQSYSMGRMKQF